MATGAARFGVSVLSMFNRSQALPQELLGNKRTGEMAFKTTDGDVISYDKFARLRNHMDTVNAQVDGMTLSSGSITRLDLDLISLPDIVPESVSFLGGQVQLQNSGLKKMLFSLDLDCIEIVGDKAIPSSNEPTIALDFSFKKGLATPVVYTFTIEKPLSVSNRNLIDVSKIHDSIPSVPADLSTYQSFLTGIKVNRNPANNGKTIRNILHHILVVMEY